MIDEFATYEAARAGFRWRVPERFNIAAFACDRWAEAEPDRTALILADGAGRPAPVITSLIV